MSKIHNPASKLSTSEVLEIYYSDKHTNDLSEQYNITPGQVTGIKRKKFYRQILENVQDPPGVHPSIRRIPLSDDIVRSIYLEDGDTKYFKEKYGVGIQVVKNIKQKKTYKKETRDLSEPGQIKCYGLYPDDVFSIKRSRQSSEDLAEKYGVCVETIYNIKSGKTRRFVDVLF